MKKTGAFLIALLTLHITIASAQHAKGYSRPGRLGKPAVSKDIRPPVITLTEPAGTLAAGNAVRGLKIVADATGALIVRGTVEDDQEVAGLTINGKASTSLSGSPTRKIFSVRMKAPAPGTLSSLDFVATDKAGNISQKIYDFQGPTAANPEIAIVLKSTNKPDSSSPTTGHYWALVIGVSQYQNTAMSLTYPENDAQEIQRVLTQYYTFDPGQVELLANPTRAQLIEALNAYAPSGTKPLTEEDNLLIYYAGHGNYDKDSNQGYWLPADAEFDKRANWVSNSDIQDAIRGIKAKHVLLLSDACFSGSLFVVTRSPSIAVQEAYKRPSRRAITAGVNQVVPDKSVFKEQIVQRLAVNADPYIGAGKLYIDIKDAVTNNSPTLQVPQYGVIHQTGDEGGEFIFVKRN